ncbi:unnamed protein product [[Candida] boidinii]|uniref:Unnamed protein product n=1 Tax=Candida boidinii TaxID=5477 RepID=A0A9W6SZV9_CANBO|nr:unnamed protein product [[Candida] boidinii]
MEQGMMVEMAMAQTTEQQQEKRMEAANQSPDGFKPPLYKEDWTETLRRVLIDITNSLLGDSSFIKAPILFMLGPPFTLAVYFFYYVLSPFHILYNFVLLVATFFTTPPLFLFLLGVLLFWIKFILVLYMDIVNRNNFTYISNLPTQFAFGTAFTASYAVLYKLKLDSSLISEEWWDTWF